MVKLNSLKAILLGLSGIALYACTALPYALNRQHPARSQDERIKHIILHYTDEQEASSLAILSKGNVSAHYLVGQARKPDGKPIVYQLVANNKRAWHAGVSAWGKRTNINDTSIGIEIVNEGCQEEKKADDISVIGHCQPFQKAQIDVIIPLLKQLVKRYNILPQNIIGHSDVAPLRKIDPGPAFPWETLAKAGFGEWPDKEWVEYFLAGRHPKEPVDVRTLQSLLYDFGYTQTPQTGEFDVVTKHMIRAFQLHFRPSDISGSPDAETMAILQALLFARPKN